MYDVRQSSALTVLIFAPDANGDPVNSIADGSWTKRISKNGGAFAAMTVTLTFLENGWYSLPLSTAHTDTLGILSMTFTATGVKQVNLQYRVQARLVDDIPTAAQVNTEVDTALADINLDHWSFNGTAVPAPVAGTHLDQVMGTSSGTYSPTVHSLRAAVDNSADMADFGILLNTTVASLTSQTVFVLAGGSDINDSYKDQVVALYDVSNNLYPSVRHAIDYVGSSRTITLDRAPDFTLAASGDVVRIFAAQGLSMDELVGPIATVSAGGGSSSSFQITVAAVNETAADWWKNAWLSFELTSSLAGQVQKISTFNQSTGQVGVVDPYTAAPILGDTARIINH